MNCIINNYSTSALWIWDCSSQRGAWRRVVYKHLISNKREWNNCFIKNAHKISRILPDFTSKVGKIISLFLIWEDTYSYHIWRPRYNGPYPMMAKPIRALELHYSMIHFLIIFIKLRLSSHGTGRIFQQLKNMTSHYVHTEPFNILALFTRTFERLDVQIFVRLKWFFHLLKRCRATSRKA